MKHLHWLIPETASNDINRLKNSTLASVRLRCVTSMLSALQKGWKVTYGDNILESPSVVLVGKIGANNIGPRQSLWLEQVKRVKTTAKIFLDYTDHHLGYNSPMTNFYEDVIKEVDGCIVPSHGMAKLLSRRWSGPIVAIEDPLEVNSVSPKLKSNKPTTLLWFGHSSNIDFLINFLSNGFLIGDHIRLIVLSNQVGLQHFSSASLFSNAKIEINLALWSLENMEEAAKIADMCIIPSDLKNPKKSGASSNRLITALTLGLPTAADNLPSYHEFRDYYSDLRDDSFRDMLNDPARFGHVVTRAQATIMPRFSMNKIGQDWVNLLL